MSDLDTATPPVGGFVITEMALLPDLSQWEGLLPDVEMLRRDFAIRVREVRPAEWRVYQGPTFAAWNRGHDGWVFHDHADVMDLPDAVETAHEAMKRHIFYIREYVRELKRKAERATEADEDA